MSLYHKTNTVLHFVAVLVDIIYITKYRKKIRYVLPPSPIISDRGSKGIEPKVCKPETLQYETDDLARLLAHFAGRWIQRH